MILNNTYLRNAFKNEAPFPNIVVDNVFTDSYMEDLWREIAPMLSDGGWYEYNNPLEVKLAREDFPEKVQQLVNVFHSEPWCAFLSGLVGVEVSPNKDMTGAGLHVIKQGGKLDIHLDHNNLASMPGYQRRLNMIFWLHPQDWYPSWGGHLELWSERDGKPYECVRRIAPLRNRMALFECSDISYHGHPDPLTCPEDVCRVSLATYYYAKDDMRDEIDRPKVLFLARPQDGIDPEMDALRERRAKGERL